MDVTLHVKVVVTIQRRLARRRVECSIHVLGSDRSVVRLVSEASDFEIAFRLLWQDRLVSWQPGLAPDAAIRPIVIRQRTGGRLVVCCRVWVLFDKRCPAIGLRDASAAGVGRAARFQRRRIQDAASEPPILKIPGFAGPDRGIAGDEDELVARRQLHDLPGGQERSCRFLARHHDVAEPWRQAGGRRARRGG
jgi:hypothetical protein